MRKSIKVALCCALGLVVAATIYVWITFGSLIKGAISVEKMDDGLYYMEYKGDDGFDELMADASGKSVVVEYVDNEMAVTETPFVTNHYLCEAKFKVGLQESDHRHETLMEQYSQANGVMNREQLTETIQSVTQLPWEEGAILGGTLWTMVMDLKNPSVTYYPHRHFEKPFHFELSRQ